MPTNNSINTDTNSFCKTANNLSDVANSALSNLNLFDTNSLSSATTLTGAAYGQTQVCTGASNYTITLPAASADKYIDFLFVPTSNAIVTVSPPSGTIDGQANLMYIAGEGCRLFSDGTNFWTQWEKVQPVSFKAAFSVDQTFPSNMLNPLKFDSVIFNVGGFYDNVGFLFTPPPGKYRMGLSVYFDGVFSSNDQIGILIVNTSAIDIAGGTTFVAVNSADVTACTSTDYFDGTTSVLGFAVQTNAGSQNISSDPGVTFFDGTRLSRY